LDQALSSDGSTTFNLYSATGGRAQAQRVGDEGRDVDLAHLQAVQISRRSLGAKIASLRGPRGPEELAEGYEAADDGSFSALGESAAAPPLGIRHKLLNTLDTRYTCLTDSLPSSYSFLLQNSFFMEENSGMVVVSIMVKCEWQVQATLLPALLTGGGDGGGGTVVVVVQDAVDVVASRTRYHRVHAVGKHIVGGGGPPRGVVAVQVDPLKANF
jgi:hypothetical protein